jgi:hypothetical protein
MSKEKRQADFQRTTTPKDSNIRESHVDITFCILPRPGPVNPESTHCFVPSFSLQGETKVTTPDVLSSQQLVKGRCDVQYWIEAEFRKSSTIVRKLKCPIDISKATAPLQMQASASTQADNIEVTIKPQTWSMLRRGWLFRPRKPVIPVMTVQIPKKLGSIHEILNAANTNVQLLELPLLFTMKEAAGCTQTMHDLMGNLIPSLSIEARWHTTKIFGTSNLANLNLDRNTLQSCVITTKTVVKHKQMLRLPPFYQQQTGQTLEGDSDKEFSACAMLELLLPDTIKCPTISAGLLRVSYELELLIRLGDGKRDNAMPCAADLKFPVIVETF